MKKREPLKTGERCCIEFRGMKLKGKVGDHSGHFIADKPCGKWKDFFGYKMKRLVPRKKPCPVGWTCENCGEKFQTINDAVRETHFYSCKKPCPPQGEEWKRRVWWLAIKAKSGMLSGCEQVIDGNTKGPPPMMLPPCSNQDMPLWTRVAEIARNEVILDKAKLAKAWDTAHVNIPGSGEASYGFQQFCKALGLESSAP